jgi:alpha-glucosidase
VEALCRQAIELRYRLLPAIYTAFWACSVDGLPIMRPLWLVDPDDPATEGLYDQYFFGNDLLVAPVTRPRAAQRLVYFPAGRWTCFHTGEERQGPGFQVVDAPLERLPLFVRAGAVLPLGPVRQATDEELECVTLRVFPAERLAGLWYDDDGQSLDHTRGAFNVWRFAGAWTADQLTLALVREAEGYASPTRRAEVRLPSPRAPREVRFAGEPAEGWRHADGWLTIPLFLVGGEVEVRW